MKKKIGLLFAFCFACWLSACSIQNSVGEIKINQDESSIGFLRPQKAPHSLEILTGSKNLDDLEAARDIPEKQKRNEYWDKKHEKKRKWLAFPFVEQKLSGYNYELKGTDESRSLSYQGEVIGSGESIKYFENAQEDFVFCAERQYPEHLRCWTRNGFFDLGYNYEVFPRFFNGDLWSVQLIDEKADRYGVFRDQELVYTFQATFITFDPILAFEVNEKGWWLSYSKSFYGEERMQDVIIHNGENLNEKYGRDQAFALFKMKNQIFYFIQKEATIGYVLNEKTFYLEGEEIAQRRCCSLGAFYPRFYPDFVAFYFKKDNFWYNALLWL